MGEGNQDREHTRRVDNINKSGYPFQRRIAKEIADAGWTIDFEKQVVVYSRATGFEEVKIDILARSGVHLTNDRRVVSVVECKRHDPKFTEWLFFSRRTDVYKSEYRDSNSAPLIWGHPTGGGISVHGKTFIQSQAGIYAGYFPGLAEWNAARYDFFLEVQKNHGGKSRPEEIARALDQVAWGVHGAIDSMYELRTSERSSPVRIPKESFPIVPVLVTTAPLFACSLEDENTSVERGILDPERVVANERKCVLCDYALPPDLWFLPGTLAEDGLADLTHMAIRVVNASFCKEFFSRVNKDSTIWAWRTPAVES